MSPITLPDIESFVETLARTAIDNEAYFSDLDAVVGDGDFGYSLARGFEAVEAEWNGFPRESVGSFLKRVALVLTSKIGGTSGPIWGTAFLRAAAVAGERSELEPAVLVEMLGAAIDGIKARGNAEVGDKTVLDVLVPVHSELARRLSDPASAPTGLALARELAGVARRSADATVTMQARRGRASYTGERSIGSPDAGATALAVIAERFAEALAARSS